MGRQEQPLDAGDGPLVLFALELRELRRQAGSPPYRQLAARTNYSASTLAEAAAGRRLPSDGVLAAFVTACGGDPVEWEHRRIRTHRLITQPPTVVRPVAAGDAVLSAEPPVAAGDAVLSAEPPVVAEDAVPSAEPPVRAADRTSVDPAPADVRSARRRAPRRQPAVLRRVLGSAVAVLFALTFGVCVPGDSAAPGTLTALTVQVPLREAARWLHPGTDIPAQYRELITEAGTGCPEPEITPALIAAMLKAESGFDPNLSDPANDEYGIARWTPRVLRHYLPVGRQDTVPTPPFTAEDSILAMGRMLCAIAPELRGVQGDPALNLAAAYRTATWVVRNHDEARLAALKPYLNEVSDNLRRYRPAPGPDVRP
ncbi:helix-turn-helix domain-containing protein [Kitasatospora aureofaciens]|uniref:helix-turn-helix domain-containing protein n=1 Tax=Kitasatospora aureofaciens TaxID=1894 RepID=UPI0027E0F661|nr:helix-turn-helix domain-containing protein [Kitasatospora aureofaciens]